MTKEQKGITLIALIITIIVLLILAVVAIAAVQDDDIIDYAKNARNQYGAEQEKENITLQNYLDMIKENVPSEDSDNGNEEGGTEEEETQEPIVIVAGDTNSDGKINYNETWTLALKTAEGTAIEGVTYTSSDTSIATVSSSGVVTGVSHGTATITITYTEDGENKTKTYDVNSVEAYYSISARLKKESLFVGETTEVIPTTGPTTKPKGTFYYSSDNTDVATVDENGVVTAVGPGAFEISVKYGPPPGSDRDTTMPATAWGFVRYGDDGDID